MVPLPICKQTGMIGFALHLTYRGFYCIFSIRQNEQIYNQNKKIQRDFTKLKVKRNNFTPYFASFFIIINKNSQTA